MLKRIERPNEPAPDPRGEIPVSAGPVDFDLLLAAARRQARVLIAAAILGLFIGLVYVITAVPQYTATTDLLIDSQKDKNDVSASIAELTFDTGAIDSQVEVLKSEKIALSVISTLKLTSDPEFMGTRGSFIGQAMTMLRSALDFDGWFVTREKLDPEKESELQRAAVAQLQNNLGVRRVARTYVLTIEYTSPDRTKAATIANAFAEAYLTDQLDAKYEATRRASGWMQARIAELKTNSLTSDLAVQKFKADHGLVTADGKLVSDQQMTELNTQMMVAHADTAKAEARYNQIAEMLKSGQTDGAVTDSLDNPVVNDLRQKYLAASKMESELESKLGPAHLQVVALRRNMAEYQRLIFDELKRIAETYRSEGEVARAKEESLNSSMSALVGQNAGTNQTMVQLRELDREAESYRTLYQSFLQRYQEAIQQQSFPITEARVITAASPPTFPSYPKRSLILALSLVLGLMAGGGIAALRELRDRVFHTASQVRDELGLDFLGMLQVVDHPTYTKTDAEQRDPNHLMPTDPLQRYSIDHPLTGFSETLRSIKVAVDLSLAERKPKIIGVISVLPNEGKSTISKNFASLLAHLGARTLLIDGDLRNPGLTRAVAPQADAGILEVIRGDHALRDLLMSERESGLSFLPTVVRKRVQHTSEVLASPGMRSLLTEGAKDFDYIIVDLPPLAPVVDVRAAASLFDAFVFVVEWGRTPRLMVQTALASDKLLYEKCVGVVFNKVHLGKIKLYESYGSKDYYYGRYSKYYRHDKEPA
jgi:succinoglycan biosynthesis transport protein ExoP